MHEWKRHKLRRILIFFPRLTTGLTCRYFPSRKVNNIYFFYVIWVSFFSYAAVKQKRDLNVRKYQQTNEGAINKQFHNVSGLALHSCKNIFYSHSYATKYTFNNVSYFPDINLYFNLLVNIQNLQACVLFGNVMTFLHCF